MKTSLQAVVAVDDEIDRGLVDSLVSGEAQIGVLDYIDIGGATASTYGTGDVLIVACLDYGDLARAYVKDASHQHPNRPIILLTESHDHGQLGDVFESGIDDVVAIHLDHHGDPAPGIGHHLAFTLEKAVVRKQGNSAAKVTGDGRIICVLGLKGGAGKTLTAVNAGVALASAGHSVALVDLDLQFGDLALALGVTPERTIYDLVRSGGSLDGAKLQDFLVEHRSGARALLAPLRPDHAAMVNAALVRELLRLLGQSFEYVIVDTPPNFTPEVIAAVDVSSDILMVATRDTLALKNTKLGLETLEQMDYDRRRIRIVLNRANTKVGISRQDVLAILGRDVDVLVPSHRDIARSVNEGIPIALQSQSPARRAFSSVAELYRDGAPAVGRAMDPEPPPAVTPAPSESSSKTPRRSLLRRAARAGG